MILPDGADTDPIERYRSRWDPLAVRVAAHITLVYPFETDTEFAVLEECLAAVARRHARFAIDLATPTIWDNEYLFCSLVGSWRNQPTPFGPG